MEFTLHDMNYETGWSVAQLQNRVASFTDNYRYNFMKEEELPETPRIFCLRQLLASGAVPNLWYWTTGNTFGRKKAIRNLSRSPFLIIF